MKKKIVSLLLCVALVMTFATACGSKTEESSVGKETGNAGSTEAFSGEYVVDASYVKENIDHIKLVDARGEETASKGTIKGAIATTWQYLANVENGKPGDDDWGLILDPAALSERLSNLGLSPDDEIILFSVAQKGWGEDGRIAWELMAAGYSNVKMVDGGYEALKKAGLETANEATKPEKADVIITNIDMAHIIHTEDLKANYNLYKVVDVRADGEYNGEVLYGETKGGHLPGAIHIRYTDLFREDGTLKSNAEIEKVFQDASLSKDDTIVTYCTAGIRSAYMQLIMQMCGYENSRNYDGSYYRWSAVNDVEK